MINLLGDVVELLLF